MIDAAFMLMMNTVLLMLRISPVDSFPKPLSQEEERDCVERAAEGDIEARNILVEHNLRLVAHIIKKYYTRGEDADDLISIGTIGLIKGINTYRNDKGVKLATYASRCIENEILMYFRSRKKTASDLSLSDALDVDDDSNGLSIIDVVSREQDMTEKMCESEIYSALREAVDTVLTAREKKIISMRYGLEGKRCLTQLETAGECGISRSYVSRIEKRALEKLKKTLWDMQ